MAAALCALVFVMAEFGAVARAAADAFQVTQKKRAFNYKEITVNAGDIVRFGNDDEFIHQVYVDSPAFKFDTAESPPGNTIDIKFTTPGTFEVHCHIHPKMKLVVKVQ